MRIVHTYSHLGGAEILSVRFPEIDAEINAAIAATESDFRTKRSRERSRQHRLLFDPRAMNARFKQEFENRGFRELRRPVAPNVPGWDTSEMSDGHKQIDFAKERVLVEVQLGKYFAMFYDMAKLEYFYRQDEADVGVEVVPSYRLAAEMSSGVGRGEMLITDIIGLQRQFPTFPVKIILIEPEQMLRERTEEMLKRRMPLRGRRSAQ